MQAARWETRKQAWEIAQDVADRCPGHLRGGERQPCAFDEWQLSKYENNRKRPCPEHQVALCQIYGKGPEELGFIAWRPQPVGPGTAPASAAPSGLSQQGEQSAPSERAASGAERQPADAEPGEPQAGPQAHLAGPPIVPESEPDGIRIALNTTNAPEIPYPEDDSASSDLTLSDVGVAATVRAALIELEVEGKGPLQRRSVVKGMWVVAGVTMTDPIAALATQVRNGLAATQVSTERLEMLESAVHRYARTYPNCTPEFAREMAADWIAVGQLLKPGVSKTPGQTMALTRLYSQLCGLMGAFEFDLGHFDRSRALFQVGQAAAREVGDTDLAAWHHAEESMAPFYAGDPHEAIKVAERGLAIAGHAQTRTVAWLHARIARSIGELASHDPSLRKEVDQRLEMARRTLDRTSGGAWDGGAGLTSRAFCFDIDRLTYYAGAAWVDAGDSQRGKALCEEATRLQAASKFGGAGRVDYSMNRFCLARAHVLGGEPAEASEIASEALRAYAGHNRNVLRWAKEVSRLLGPYRSEPVVREYHALLRERVHATA